MSEGLSAKAVAFVNADERRRRACESSEPLTDRQATLILPMCRVRADDSVGGFRASERRRCRWGFLVKDGVPTDTGVKSNITQSGILVKLDKDGALVSLYFQNFPLKNHFDSY